MFFLCAVSLFWLAVPMAVFGLGSAAVWAPLAVGFVAVPFFTTPRHMAKPSA